jgi:hypothetical protein
MNKLLKVVSIEDAKDSKGIAYKKVGFEPLVKSDGMEVLTNDSTRYRNLWAERELADKSIIKADPLFAKVKIGSLVAGEIRTLATTPYMLEERTVHTYTGVIFSNENAETVANRNLRANNAKVIKIDADGTIVSDKEEDTPELNTSGIGTGPKKQD